MGRHTLSTRKVLIAEVQDRHSNRTGFGEAAPLPEFGTESLRSAETALRKAQALAEEGKDLRAITDDAEVRKSRMACFAIETAQLDIESGREALPLFRYLGSEDAAGSLRVNAVIPITEPGETQQAVARYLDEGYRCLKLKVRAQELDADVDRIAAARERAGADILIRLDANGAWSVREAERAIHKLEPYAIEYIEQPIAPEKRDAMLGIGRDSPIPIAADESAHLLEECAALLQSGNIPVFILKPMVLGSLAGTRSLIADILAEGKKAVVTAFLDSAVGRAAAIQLAASVPGLADVHHGLSTGTLFANDLADFGTTDGGVLSLPEEPGLGVHIDAARLTPVD